MLLLLWNQSIDVVQWWLHTVDRPVTSDMWHVTWASSALTCTDHCFSATDQSLFTNSHSKILLNIVPSPFKSVLEAVFSKLAKVFLSSDVTPPQHLAYVKWFSSISTMPDNNSQLYKVSRLTQNGWHIASVIPVDHILSSVHLLPCFGQDTPSWNTFSVLELCQNFYINPFTNHDIFLLFMWNSSDWISMCLQQ